MRFSNYMIKLIPLRTINVIIYIVYMISVYFFHNQCATFNNFPSFYTPLQRRVLDHVGIPDFTRTQPNPLFGSGNFFSMRFGLTLNVLDSGPGQFRVEFGFFLGGFGLIRFLKRKSRILF